jgi:hypothetical protein
MHLLSRANVSPCAILQLGIALLFTGPFAAAQERVELRLPVPKQIRMTAAAYQAGRGSAPELLLVVEDLDLATVRGYSLKVYAAGNSSAPLGSFDFWGVGIPGKWSVPAKRGTVQIRLEKEFAALAIRDEVLLELSGTFRKPQYRRAYLSTSGNNLTIFESGN